MSTLLYNVTSSRDWRAKVQNGFWTLKVIMWIAITLLTFTIPNGVYTFLAKYLYMPASVIFIIIQLILLIDFAYNTSRFMIERWESTNDRNYLIALLAFTGTSYIGSVLLTGFLYSWFGGSSCPLNQFFITFNWLIFFMVSALSLVPKIQELNPSSGLAQAAIVTVYSSYLLLSSLMSIPGDMKCSNAQLFGDGENLSVLLGALLTFLSLAYSTTRAASSDLLSEKPTYGPIQLDDGENGVSDDEQEAVQYSYSGFHIIFFLGSLYIAMIITDVCTSFPDHSGTHLDCQTIMGL
jgi:hypothetical protein